MASGYKIREHLLSVPELRVLVLMREDDEIDFLERMEGSKRGRQRQALIVKTLEKVQLKGIPLSERSRIVKLLDSELCVAEVRVPGKVIRVMGYIHARGTDLAELVLLFDFDGHQGTNKIPKRLMDKGRKLAAIAKLNMEEG